MRASFLVVEDDPYCAQELADRLGELGDITVCESIAAARALLSDERSFTAMFLDIELPDGFGWELLDLHCRKPVATRVLVLTQFVGRGAIRRAQGVGVEFAAKPLAEAHLARFVEDALVADGRPRAATLRLIRDVTVKHRVSPRENTILQLAMVGRTQREMATILSVSVETIKTQVGSLRRKTKAVSLDDLCERIRALAT